MLRVNFPAVRSGLTAVLTATRKLSTGRGEHQTAVGAASGAAWLTDFTNCHASLRSMNSSSPPRALLDRPAAVRGTDHLRQCRRSNRCYPGSFTPLVTLLDEKPESPR